MSFELRLAIMALASFVTAGAAAALYAAWRSARPVSGNACERATALLAIRLAPTVVAGAWTILTGISFALFESRGDEALGWTLSILALSGAALFAASAWRGIRMARATRRAWRHWASDAEPLALDGADMPAFAVSASFPIVAVVGLWRPTLIVARSVLDACSREELAAILRHESVHARRYDNVRRALLELAPDPLALLPASRRLVRAWHEATEDAADDFARASADRGGVTLASALVKVARLAPAAPFDAWMPASALYRGENLERRVRRLLAAPDVATRRSRAAWWLVPAAIALPVAVVVLPDLHILMERVVHLLP